MTCDDASAQVIKSTQQRDRAHSLRGGKDGRVLVAQLRVLLDVLDEVDERVLVELPVAEVRLVLEHALGCKARERRERRLD